MNDKIVNNMNKKKVGELVVGDWIITKRHGMLQVVERVFRDDGTSIEFLRLRAGHPFGVYVLYYDLDPEVMVFDWNEEAKEEI